MAGPILTCGFAAAVVLWTAWFVTHLPWLGLSEQVALPMLLAVWLTAAAWCGWQVGPRRVVKVGLASGVVTALLSLLILGSKLVEPSDGAAPGSVRPGIGLIAVGFLTLGAAIGLIGGVAGSLLRNTRSAHAEPPDWLARFAVVAAAAIAPLLVVGGLVTSTDSGMAVPDWPNTYGANMFLYPLGPRAAPDIFLEHSHRLFGSLVGLAVLVLAVYVFRAEPRRWVRVMAVLAFALVVAQGVLGGGRVLLGSANLAEDNRWLAMLHGVLAQLVFGLVVALAVVLSPAYRRDPLAGQSDLPAGTRAAKFWTTGLLHSMLLQLLLGAMYRHLRASHALWTHIAFSIVVFFFAMAAGFVLMGLGRPGGVRGHLHRTGQVVMGVVIAQFALGWAAFAASGPAHQSASATEALIRTGHQANGALLLAAATAGFIWTRRLVSAARAVQPLATPA